MELIRDYEAMAKLDLPEDQRKLIQEKADRRLSAFAAMDSVETEHVTPLVSVLDLQNIMREDVVNQTVTREELLETAPEQYDGYFQVPRTLE